MIKRTKLNILDATRKIPDLPTFLLITYQSLLEIYVKPVKAQRIVVHCSSTHPEITIRGNYD